MQSSTLYFSTIILTLLLFALNPVFSKDSVRFIETTGRAVIEDAAEVVTARRRSLEDALYLAALHGGAKIKGFSSVSTDTSIQENLVVQPDSYILDYNIISEDQTDTHFIIKIRAAVGNLKSDSCENQGLKSISVYKPIISIHPNVPYWVQPLSSELIKAFMSSLKAEMNINLTDFTNTSLNQSELKSINDEFDYTSLTSGRSRTRSGDYAVVPSINIDKSTKLVGFTTFNSLEITFLTNIYEGASYSLSSSKSKTVEALFKSTGPWRNMNLLLKSSRENIVEPILLKASEHSLDVAKDLICKKIHSRVAINNGQIEVPLGKRHGITLSSLAVTKGDQTPFNIFRVEKVLENKSFLVPLNDSVEVNKFSGKSIQFLGKM